VNQQVGHVTRNSVGVRAADLNGNCRLKVQRQAGGCLKLQSMEGANGFLLEENGSWEFAEGKAVLPADPTQQATHLKKDVKRMRIIVDGVKDHIFLHLSGKKTTKDMWQALVKLYQSDNQCRKMLLKEKLRSTKMATGESVVTYLTKFTQIRDELAAVGEAMDEIELVRTTLNGFTKQWEVFVWEWWLGKNSLIGRGHGMTSPRRSCELMPLKLASQRVKRRRMWFFM
jgi:hypothetical protein